MFLINSFRSLENNIVRSCTLKYISLPIWFNLSASRLELELEENPNLRKHYEYYQSQQLKSNSLNKVETNSTKGKKKSKTSSTSSGSSEVTMDENEIKWLYMLINQYINTIENFNIEVENSSNIIKYIERFTEFLIDLLSQLPTRRFLNTLLDDMHLIIKCNYLSMYLSIYLSKYVFISLSI
jgi:intron-binding protein aquarius